MLKYPTDRGPKVPDTQETLRAVRDLCGVTALWFKNPWSTEIACGLRPWGPCQVDLNCIISVDRSGEPQGRGSAPVDRIYQWDHGFTTRIIWYLMVHPFCYSTAGVSTLVTRGNKVGTGSFPNGNKEHDAGTSLKGNKQRVSDTSLKGDKQKGWTTTILIDDRGYI